MSVAKDDARDAAAIALYKAITQGIADAEGKGLEFRVPYLETLSNAYAAVTFGVRSK